MTVSPLSLRPLLFGALAVALVSQSGCAWTRGKLGMDVEYQESRQGEPLEVPAGLDTPPLGAAVVVPDATSNAPLVTSDVPPSSLGGAAPAADDLPPTGVAGIGEFAVAGGADDTWRRIGEALPAIAGVTVGDRAKLLNSYEVTYRRTTFLLRAEATADGSRVVALGANGQPVTTGAPAELLALLRDQLAR
ncbi:MAG TPA: hypothetical protein VFQ84_13275 [Arenimonas sp.]|uniref:hypothetical protein n=1 Tax=Arenimonas sp. TaxID=1872635 RepID=UPI002D804EC5|nr:hypothetical protein [Arenimonas sp.]HEU0154303.1 hypothetical protein [Arenimonas sp.]